MPSTMLVLLLLALGQAVVPQAESAPPVKLFLGPIPSAEGFVAHTTRVLDDSYRDLREEFEKDRSLHPILELVADPEQAQLLLEIANRRVKDTGMRTGSATAVTGTTAVGTSLPVLRKQLYARLAVKGSDYRLEIDGAAGLKRVTFRNQARNVLRQAAAWVNTNRSKLEAR